MSLREMHHRSLQLLVLVHLMLLSMAVIDIPMRVLSGPFATHAAAPPLAAVDVQTQDRRPHRGQVAVKERGLHRRNERSFLALVESRVTHVTCSRHSRHSHHIAEAGQHKFRRCSLTGARCTYI